MTVREIQFVAPGKAELRTVEVPEPGDRDVVVETVVSSVSAGTEKANLLGDPNVAGGAKVDMEHYYPRALGYSSAGTVVRTGGAVTRVKEGDRVVVYWGKHRDYNSVSEQNVVKIPDNVPFSAAALSFIGTFPLAAIRKTHAAIGEAALVMGEGTLGNLATLFLREAGCAPVVAVDPVEARREKALLLGADYAFDPTDPAFAENVKRVTGGGAKVCVEVTGRGKGLDQALDCMARFGRVALLGCTRDSNFTIDYYGKVHFPGITLIGAHTRARPDLESRDDCYTHIDDIASILKMQSLGRFDLDTLIADTRDPADCAAVYADLASNPAFPTVTQFRWK